MTSTVPLLMFMFSLKYFFQLFARPTSNCAINTAKGKYRLFTFLFCKSRQISWFVLMFLLMLMFMSPLFSLVLMLLLLWKPDLTTPPLKAAIWTPPPPATPNKRREDTKYPVSNKSPTPHDVHVFFPFPARKIHRPKSNTEYAEVVYFLCEKFLFVNSLRVTGVGQM